MIKIIFFRIDYNPFDFVTVVTPGLTQSYRYRKRCLSALQRRSDLCTPRNETIGPPILLQQIGRPIVKIYKSLTDPRMWK
jgi:hypothetical protein